MVVIGSFNTTVFSLEVYVSDEYLSFVEDGYLENCDLDMLAMSDLRY